MKHVLARELKKKMDSTSAGVFQMKSRRQQSREIPKKKNEKMQGSFINNFWGYFQYDVTIHWDPPSVYKRLKSDD